VTPSASWDMNTPEPSFLSEVDVSSTMDLGPSSTVWEDQESSEYTTPPLSASSYPTAISTEPISHIPDSTPSIRPSKASGNVDLVVFMSG